MRREYRFSKSCAGLVLAQIQIKRRTFGTRNSKKLGFTIVRMSSSIGHDFPFLEQSDTVRFAIDFVESFVSDLLLSEGRKKKEEKRCVREAFLHGTCTMGTRRRP